MDYVDLNLLGSDVFNLATTPRIIVPALGPGLIIRPAFVEAWYQFNGGPFNYTTPPRLIVSPLAQPTSRLQWGSLDLSMLNRQMNCYNTALLGLQPSNGIETATLDNVPVYISLSSPLQATLATNSALKVRLNFLASSRH
jgi:hypothetical protein